MSARAHTPRADDVINIRVYAIARRAFVVVGGPYFYYVRIDLPILALQ